MVFVCRLDKGNKESEIVTCAKGSRTGMESTCLNSAGATERRAEEDLMGPRCAQIRRRPCPNVGGGVGTFPAALVVVADMPAAVPVMRCHGGLCCHRTKLWKTSVCRSESRSPNPVLTVPRPGSCSLGWCLRDGLRCIFAGPLVTRRVQ